MHFKVAPTSSDRPSPEAFYKMLTTACADAAWWFGWSVSDIDNLEWEDFLLFQKEAARQVKAGYRKGCD